MGAGGAAGQMLEGRELRALDGVTRRESAEVLVEGLEVARTVHDPHHGLVAKVPERPGEVGLRGRRQRLDRARPARTEVIRQVATIRIRQRRGPEWSAHVAPA